MSRRTRGPAGLATAAALAALLLTACGDATDDPYAVPERFQEYCEEVEAQQVEISDALAAGGRASGLIRALPSFQALADEAPDDIADEWKVVVERIQELVDALDAAGVDPEAYKPRRPPPGLDRDEKAAIDAAATALVSSATARAMSGVEQQARDVCKTQLAL